MDESNTIKADDTIAAIVPSKDIKGAELQTFETYEIEAFGEVHLARRVLAGAVDLFLVFVLFHVIGWLIPKQLQIDRLWQLDFALLWVLYSACFESSPLQTTPGKHLHALQVVGKHGTHMTFRDACLNKAGFILLCLLAPLGLQLGLALSAMIGVLALFVLVVMGGVGAYQKLQAHKTTESDQLLVTPTDDDEPLPAQKTAIPEAATDTAQKTPALQRPGLTDNATVTCRPCPITIQLPIATPAATWED